MHEIQKVLLTILQERGIQVLPPLRKLGELTGKTLSAQQVKHHLEQLQKKGFISIDKNTKKIEITVGTEKKSQKQSFYTLPLYGAVNCGPALSLAEQIPESFIKISSNILKGFRSENLFVVRASGDSMNKAVVGGKRIEDGDFLVVDTSKVNIRGKGEIVLSIIDGAANIKRLYKEQDSFVLVSDSTKDYPPIYISISDDFSVNGTVVAVMKKPKG
ncbi:S24 family peptidase [Patescibacteria group bacterium]|nr:S24 family peptidase [Patescibacteria group bacterium]